MSVDRPSRDRRLLGCWAIAASAQAMVALVSLWNSSAFGYGGKLLVFDDVELYFGYARPILEGLLPYRDYPVEYPVLAIPFFVAPLIVGVDFDLYKFAFAIEMLAINAGAIWMVARQVEESEGIERVPGRLAWYSLCFVALCPMIAARFDLAPMLLAFAAARWMMAGRRVRGGLRGGPRDAGQADTGLVVVPFLAGEGSWRSKGRGWRRSP